MDTKAEIERLQAGIPLFKDKKSKNGWTLNMFQQNVEILSASLYDSSGKMIEIKAFMTQKEEHVEKLKEYVALFEDDPEKNLRKMTRITLT